MNIADLINLYRAKLKEFIYLPGNPYYILKNKYELMRITDEVKIPPMFLRQRVHGTRDIHSFLRVGKNCANDLTRSIKKIGKNWPDFPMILDFGCGCGRVLRFLANHSNHCRFSGTDMDGDSISWCVNNIQFANFLPCDPEPPLKYAVERFDLIYAVSVFTHLHEKLQLTWLNELKRIMKKNAILLITVEGSLLPTIGNYCGSDLSSEDISSLKAEQIISKQPKNTDYFARYVSYTHTYQTKEYIYEKWSKHFKIVNFISRGLNNHHDIVILKR